MIDVAQEIGKLAAFLAAEDAEAIERAREDRVLAWHWCTVDILGRPILYDGTPVIVGQTLTRPGLRASIQCMAALRYAPGTYVCRVSIGGDDLSIVSGDITGTRRTVIWGLDARQILIDWAHDCAPQYDAHILSAARLPAAAGSVLTTIALAAADTAALAAAGESDVADVWRPRWAHAREKCEDRLIDMISAAKGITNDR